MAFTVSQTMGVVSRTSGGSVNTFTITDTSNYVYNAYDINDYVGVLKVTIPGGTVIYENTNYLAPDIAVGLGSKTFPMPLDSNENIIQGDYVVVLSIRNKDTLVVSTNTTTYTYAYSAPTIELSLTADGFNSTLVSEDITDYGTLVVTYDHTLTVPVGSGLSDQTSTTDTITLPANIWSGTYVTVMANDVVYTNGFLTVNDHISGTISLLVYNLSRDTVFEAITLFNNTYNNTIGTNPKLAREYAITSTRLNGYLAEYNKGVQENDGQECYDALTAISLLLWPDFIDDLFTTTEEIIPFDFRVSTDAEAIAFIQALTATTAEINYLHGLNVASGRIVYGDGSKLTSRNDLRYDGTNLLLPNGSDIIVDGDSYFKVLLYRDNSWTGDNDFTKNITVPTKSVDDNSSEAASTAFVINQAYAKREGPIFTGTVILPSTTSIGNVSSTEIGYLDGVTSSIQTQITNHIATIPSSSNTGHVKAGTGITIDNVTGVISTSGGVTPIGATWGSIASLEGGSIEDQIDLMNRLNVKANASNNYITFTGMTTSLKTKTVRDASDTILELGGSYTPTGTWTSIMLNENVALTTTSTKLNYLTSATGTTGTSSTNIVFSASPTLTGNITFPSGIWNSSGNVGIGTNTATNKVTVVEDSVFNQDSGGQIVVKGASDSNKSLRIGYDTTSNYAWLQAIIVGTSTSNLHLQPFGGSVGIGVTPLDLLHVAGNTRSRMYKLTNSSETIKWVVKPNGDNLEFYIGDSSTLVGKLTSAGKFQVKDDVEAFVTF